MDLAGFGWRLASVDPIFIRLRSCVYGWDPSELCFSSTMAVVVLVLVVVAR